MSNVTLQIRQEQISTSLYHPSPFSYLFVCIYNFPRFHPPTVNYTIRLHHAFCCMTVLSPQGLQMGLSVCHAW